ncbi:MAG: hypothetical protein JWL70_2750, partial [Acidimicrobiia bacterium]|nr:hypothetical protein [Acidimicrobiia bacterium]
MCFFSAKTYDRDSFVAAAAGAHHHVVFLEPRLDITTVALAEGA